MKTHVHTLEHGTFPIFDVEVGGRGHSFLDVDGLMYGCDGPWKRAGKESVQYGLEYGRFSVPLHPMPVEVKSTLEAERYEEVVYIVSADKKKMGILARNKPEAPR